MGGGWGVVLLIGDKYGDGQFKPRLDQHMGARSYQ